MLSEFDIYNNQMRNILHLRYTNGYSILVIPWKVMKGGNYCLFGSSIKRYQAYEVLHLIYEINEK